MAEHKLQQMANIVARLHERDEEAAMMLVRLYGGVLRRAIERVLRSNTAQGSVSASDVCQMTLLEFVERAMQGQYQSLTDQDLRNLLLDIGCKNAIDEQRRAHAACRDVRRVESTPVELLALADDCDCRQQSSSSDLQERLKQALDRLPASDRELLLARQSGWSWKELAREHQMSYDAVRMKYARALERLQREFGVSE